MDGLPHVFQQVLATAPFAPAPSINDDDVFLVDLRTMKPIRVYGASSATAEEVRRGGVPARLGQGWMKGMQLRHMQESRGELTSSVERLIKGDDPYLTPQGLRNLARAAIAKATGEAS